MERSEVARLEAEWIRTRRDVEELDREHNKAMQFWRQRSAIAEAKYFEASRLLREELDARGR